jgi:hypothetical protein
VAAGKIRSKQDPNVEKRRNSIRVSASKINRERRKVFALWLPWWEAELRHLDQFIKRLPLGKFSARRRR